ncbi:MAG: 4-(cytidine 5'-diphospho)-2-C-methyl-D-erythritol kinase [Burkholderiaceae bacterium]
MQALYDVPAPAKLNLFLHLTGRRADGYHLLQSAFMLIDWCDTLHFELRRDGRITREDHGETLPAEDLIVRAARALQQAKGSALGVHIAVVKRIPAQAGMGGGSSDAASTLLALNRLWRLGLTRTQLAAIGLQLGADVPFFLHGGNAWVEGIGEQIRPMSLPQARFVVIKPRAGLDTGAIFRAPELKRDSEPATITGFAADPFGFGRNDLQPVAERLCPPVAQGLELLAQQGLKGRMTGSGSAVFAPLAQEADVFARLSPKLAPDWRMRLCSNLEVHPLGGWASSDN